MDSELRACLQEIKAAIVEAKTVNVPKATGAAEFYKAALNLMELDEQIHREEIPGLVNMLTEDKTNIFEKHNKLQQFTLTMVAKEQPVLDKAKQAQSEFGRANKIIIIP